MDKGFPEDLRSLFSEGERVIWLGRAELKPFILRRLPGAILPLAFILMPLTIFPDVSAFPSQPFLALFFTFWFGISGLMVFYSSLYPLLLWRNLYYVLTDRRIIVRKGVVGIDYDILNLEQIQEINIDRGIWDKIYGTGSIVIQAIGVSPIRVDSVGEPFKIQGLMTKAVRAYKGLGKH